MLFNCHGIQINTSPPTTVFEIYLGDYQARSVTLDGTYGSTVTLIVTEANAGDTVTFALPSWGFPPIVQTSHGTEIECTYITTYTTGGSGRPPTPIEPWVVYQFEMPSDSVTIDLNI